MPIVIVVLMAAFTFMVIRQSVEKRYLFKSCMLAVLFCASTEWQHEVEFKKDIQRETISVGALRERAKDSKAVFEVDEDGNLKLKKE